MRRTSTQLRNLFVFLLPPIPPSHAHILTYTNTHTCYVAVALAADQQVAKPPAEHQPPAMADGVELLAIVERVRKAAGDSGLILVMCNAHGTQDVKPKHTYEVKRHC